ncbi:site-specific DNA-methyltransferase, partial [Pelistega sp. MC2]|uniref:site-specific DNA-methyltransferase n=1 Tax=Pelistega sp. MC2 TaxID=1720297 RepID=UPI0008D8DF7B
MKDLDMHTSNLVAHHIDQIAAILPNCITESHNAQGKLIRSIDFDILKQELSDVLVEGSQERYRLDWPGKKEAILAANSPIAKTLRPCHEESVNFDTTENLFIEGDNLEALKLLQESYLGKVKMIYIDPPYNTGNDFVYNDDFSESVEDYMEKSQSINAEGQRLTLNTESNGRFHSDWLSMMYSRLKLARNLLSDDGVIFISIDDNEQDNLKKICDEVFGEENFLSSFVWKTRQASGKQIAASNISTEHEYAIVYSKNALTGSAFKGAERDRSAYSNPDNDSRGIWAKHPLDVGSTKTERPNCFYTLIDPNTGISYEANPNRVWAYAPDSMRKLIAEGKIIFHPEGKTRPYLKKFFSELKSENKPISSWLQKEVFNIGYNTEGTKITNSIFDNQKVFDYPKPVSLLKLFIEQASDSDSIILDFFAGSGTTAHAVMQLNAEDGGNRKFIMVQLPELTDEKSEAYKAGYKTIAEISKERIRRAGAQIAAQHSTAQHSTAQHSTAQHSTAQHSTAQHSTAQHPP